MKTNEAVADEGTEPGIEEQFEHSMRASLVTGGEPMLPAERTARMALDFINQHGMVGGITMVGALLAMIGERAAQIREGLSDKPDSGPDADTLVSDLIYLSGVIDLSEAGTDLARTIFQRLANRMHERLRTEKKSAPHAP